MPDFEWEDKCRGIVCGIDEAGRGPWAGPVVAGAVIIKDRNLHPDLLSGLDDSKKLSAKKREKLYNLLFEEEKNGKVEIGIGEASCAEIDEYNILNATFMAMERARAGLKTPPELALVDGNQKPRRQRAAQFPDGVMERMIDFNPEEETITIPTPQTAGLNTASHK